MKIKGYRFTCENPFFVYFKKHYCPCCGNRLMRQKVSEVIHSDSEEAKNYDFSAGDFSSAVGNIKFIWTEFQCDACSKTFSINEIRESEKNK